MRRLPPQQLESNLATIVDLMPNHVEDLMSTIDQPLKTVICPTSHNEFLVCDYNRNGDSFRSPWSNEYVPPLDPSSSGAFPYDDLRKLEQDLNEAFIIYFQMYYENGGLTSAYVWNLEAYEKPFAPIIETTRRKITQPFAATILIKKISDTTIKVDIPTNSKGGWDAIHVLEIKPIEPPIPINNDLEEKKKTHWAYKLTSTILLYLNTSSANIDHMDLSGSISRQLESNFPVIEDHDPIGNIGRLIEEMESKMRSLVQEIYFGKTKNVVNEIRVHPDIVSSFKKLPMPLSE